MTALAGRRSARRTAVAAGKKRRSRPGRRSGLFCARCRRIKSPAAAKRLQSAECPQRCFYPDCCFRRCLRSKSIPVPAEGSCRRPARAGAGCPAGQGVDPGFAGPAVGAEAGRAEPAEAGAPVGPGRRALPLGGRSITQSPLRSDTGYTWSHLLKNPPRVS